MTDPKTAARAVATRLAQSEISIKHVQALDLVAAGCGFQDRSKLKDLAVLPVLKRVNRRLLESVATVLARHDLTRRATIVETTSEVLVPTRMFDMRTVRESGERIGTGLSKGVVPFMKIQADAIASVSQGGTYREGYAHFAPITDEPVLRYVSDRPGIGAFLNEMGAERGHVIAATSDDQPGDPWTVFWNENDGWVAFDSATVYSDESGDLPTAGMPANAAVRWMGVEDAAFRAAVDAATLEMDQDEPELGFDPEVPGERLLDYDRIAAMIALSKVFVRPMGPLEIAVRDGAQRASLYTVSLSEDPDTAGGRVREWIGDVERAFRGGLAPDEDTLRALLVEGDEAIGGIRNWLPADERLWSWLNVSAHPDAISNEIDAEGSGVVSGIDMKPLEQVLAGLKAQFAPDGPDRAKPATLDELRETAAQARLVAHAFRDDYVVGEMDRWERTTPGDVWTRTLYMESDQADVDDVSEAATYSVTFAPGTDRVVSSCATSENGFLIGHPIDPENDRTLDLGNGFAIALAAVTGELPLSLSPGVDALLAEVTRGAYHSAWSPFDDGMSKETATSIASAAIAGLRVASDEEERERARMRAVATFLPKREASETCWSEVREGARAIVDSIDSAMEDLVEAGDMEEAVDYDRDEMEQAIMDLAFEKLDQEDDSTWRDAVKGRDVVELYLHLVPKGDSVEETCTVGSPHLDPGNVIVDDQFRFVLSRLGITGKAWKTFARPKEVEPYKARFAAMRTEPLVSPEQLGAMIENGCTTNFLVSLYCQAPLTDVLDLDLSKPIAFERVRLAVMDVMSGTFHDHRLEGVVEMTDGDDGLLTTSDCGPYASQTEDLVASAYFSRVGTSEVVARGPAATAELDAHLAVEGLRRSQPGDRVAWRETGGDGGSVVLKAEVPCQDAAHTYGLRTMTAVFEDDMTTRPDIMIERRR